MDGRGAQTHFVFALNAGFGTVLTDLPCPVAYSFDGQPDRRDCIETFSGISLGAGAGIMWGRKIRMGLRVDGNLINAPKGGRGGMADALFVTRWHAPPVIIIEGGVGVGLAAAQSLDAQRQGLGVALHGMVGLPVSEHVAGTLRLASVIGGLGAFTSTIGLEWSF